MDQRTCLLSLWSHLKRKSFGNQGMKISLGESKRIPPYRSGFHLSLFAHWRLLYYFCKFRCWFKGMLVIFYSAFLGAVVSSLIFALERFSNIKSPIFGYFFFIKQDSYSAIRCKKTWIFVEFVRYTWNSEIQNFHQDIFRHWCFC